MPVLFSRLSLVSGVALAGLTLAGAGCSTNADAPLSNRHDARGQVVSSGIDLQVIPPNFPSDAPKYANGKTTVAFVDPDGKSASLVQETGDSVAQVQASIENSLSAQGFTKQAGGVISADVVILSFSKGSVRYQVNIAHQNDKTQIQSIRSEQ